MTLLSCILASVCLAPIPADAGVKKTPPILRIVQAECQSTTVRKSAIATSVFKITHAKGYEPFAIDYINGNYPLRKAVFDHLILIPYDPGEKSLFIVRIDKDGSITPVSSPLNARELCPDLSLVTKSQDKDPNRTQGYAYLLSLYLIDPKGPKLPPLLKENKGSDDADLANLAKWIEGKIEAQK